MFGACMPLPQGLKALFHLSSRIPSLPLPLSRPRRHIRRRLLQAAPHALRAAEEDKALDLRHDCVGGEEGCECGLLVDGANNTGPGSHGAKALLLTQGVGVGEVEGGGADAGGDAALQAPLKNGAKGQPQQPILCDIGNMKVLACLVLSANQFHPSTKF
jgi:hypothetical protein